MAEENKATPEADATAETVAEGSEAKEAPTAYDELRSFMEARDLKSPDDLTGYVENLGSAEQWQQKYGTSENKVGELRRELEAMKAQIQQQAYSPEYGEQQTAVNIKDIVGQEIRGVLSEMQQQQQQSQMKYLTERSNLMKRPGWNDVQPHFDRAMQDPQVQYALQSGNLSQERLYSQINERVLMSKVNTFVKQMPEGAVSQPPPNAETSDRIQQPTPEIEAKKQRMDRAIENQDVDALLKDLIPDDDPIVRY
jgi:replicative superfamily II helicase